jgi:organic radical activating enzyme
LIGFALVRKGFDYTPDYKYELKLVYPQPENHPNQFIHLSFENFYIQPLEDENWENNTALSVEFVKNNPQWRLSVQTHKYLNIP